MQVPRAPTLVAPAPAITAQFPARRSTPELRRARALPTWAVGQSPLSAQLDVCVSPRGDTASVEVRGSSGDRVVDDAIAEDVSEWRYEPFVAPAHTVACRRTTVTLVP
jgi:hypothetical protein